MPLTRTRNARRYFPGGGTVPPPPNSGSSLLTGLDASWKLNHVTWLDETASDLDLTNAADPGYAVGAVAGKIANAAEFSVVGKTRLTHAFNTKLDIAAGADRTFDLWFKVYNFTQPNYLITLWSNTATHQRFRFSVSTAKKLAIQFRDSTLASTPTLTFSTLTDLVAGNWYHATLRWNHTAQTFDIRLHAPGTAPQSQSLSYISGFSTGTSGVFALGASVASTTINALDGLIDNVGDWARLLTDAESDQLYNNTLGLEYPFDGTIEDVSTPPADGLTFYASQTGSANGSGNIAQPWDLRTLLTGGPTGLEVNAALALLGGTTPITLYIRGGTYPARIKPMNLNGNASHLIVIRNYPGEKVYPDGYGVNNQLAIIDFTGSNCAYVDIVSTDDGLFMQHSNADRISLNGGSNPSPDDSGGRVGCKGIYLSGDHIRAIGVWSRDTSDAYWMQEIGIANAIYGCFAINCGWNGPNTASERGHGHGVYSQNGGPAYKLIQLLVSIGQFSTGGKSYSEGTRADYFKWIQNILADNSLWYGMYWGNNQRDAQEEAIQYNTDIHDIWIKGSHLIQMTTQPTPARGGTLQVGGVNGPNENIQVVGNYQIGATEQQLIKAVGVLDYRHNTCFADVGGAPRSAGSDRLLDLSQLASQSAATWTIDRNRYFSLGRGPNVLRYAKAGVPQYAGTIAAWRTLLATAGATAPEANSSLTLAAPTFKETFVMPVSHPDYPTPGRAHLVSYNFPLDNTVTFVLKHVITTSGAISTGARTIPVNALTGSLGGQQTLVFGAVTVTLERPAIIGDTVLYIEAAPSGISSGATATFDVGLTNGQTWEVIDLHHPWDTAIDPADAAHFLYSNEFVPVATGTYLTASPTITLDVRTIANGGPLQNYVANPGGLYQTALGAALNVPNPATRTGVFLLRPTS